MTREYVQYWYLLTEKIIYDIFEYLGFFRVLKLEKTELETIFDNLNTSSIIILSFFLGRIIVSWMSCGIKAVPPPTVPIWDLGNRGACFP